MVSHFGTLLLDDTTADTSGVAEANTKRNSANGDWSRTSPLCSPYKMTTNPGLDSSPTTVPHKLGRGWHWHVPRIAAAVSAGTFIDLSLSIYRSSDEIGLSPMERWMSWREELFHDPDVREPSIRTRLYARALLYHNNNALRMDRQLSLSWHISTI
jgi:hypothetical protein